VIKGFDVMEAEISVKNSSRALKNKTTLSNNKPGAKSARSLGFQDYQFNIKQISELLGVSRAAIYQLEKSNAIKGQEVVSGTSTKKMFSWDDIAVIVDRIKNKAVKPRDNKVKVFANLKGGVGKSSLASQFAMRASAMGLKTLLIDLDAQAHATLALGIEVNDSCPTILNCMIGKGEDKMSIEEVIQPITPFLSLIPASLSLSTLEAKLHTENRRVEKLQLQLAKIRDQWDLIVIDTNPSASILNINALLAADELCVVCATDFLSVTGLKQLFEIIKDLQEDFQNFGPSVRVIPNLFDVREAIAQESLGVLRQSYREILTNTVVRKNVDLKESQKDAQAVWLYNRKSPAAEDIIALTDELIREDASDDN
jgi:chromosome partitioning protein